MLNGQIHPVEDYDDHFNCIRQSNNNRWMCCGYNAIGERHCDYEEAWEKYESKYRRCVKVFGNGQTYQNPSDLVGEDIDMCCDAHYAGNEEDSFVHNCGKCHQFYVWNFGTSDEMEAASTLDLNWRDDFIAQNLVDTDGYDNNVFPAGFQKGTLREFNDPNVCVYVPWAAGKVIEIKVESEEYGDRLCIGDVHDETTDRNDPGQNDACGNTMVKTCFGDANLDGVNGEGTEYGFPFYIFCDEACEEGGGSGDVPLWFRARFSPTSWLEGTYNAEKNVEMWCEYVVRDYPLYDQYPSEVSTLVDPILREDEDSSSYLVVFLALASILAFY